MTELPRPRLDQSVGVSLVRSIVQEFERTGLDSRRLLADAGIEPSMLDDPYARLDLPRYRELQTFALERSRDPAFGLSMGEHASLGAFGIVGHLVMHCRTLREALQLCARYYLLVADADAPHFSEDHGEAVLVYEFLRGSDAACNRMRAEFGLARLVLTAKVLLGKDVLVHRATFEHARPEYAARYSKLFGSEIRFDAPETTLVFPAALLDQRLLHHDEGVLTALRDQADRMMSELGETDSVARKLRRVVQGALPGTPPDAEELAKRLGVSGRSLRRLLRQEGHTVQSVISAAVRDAACSLLSDPAVTIQDTAHRLGFSEPSAFHRAFKRWTGLTPAEWRKQQGQKVP